MPTINKTYATTKPKKRRYKTKSNNDNHRYVYNTSNWRNLRLEYLKQNPLCECCKKENILTLATEVHHIIPISSTNNIQEKQRLGFDWFNLQALCEDCHIKIHNS